MSGYNFQFCPTDQVSQLNQVRNFLTKMDLGIDPDVQCFVVAYDGDKIIGCGGLAQNILKSIAIDDHYQGEGVSLKLLTQLTNYAYSQGQFHLFIYTKPQNTRLFSQASFYPLATVSDKVVLMENSSNRLSKYCQALSKKRHEGDKIGGIVMNANPFTLGHKYLVEQSAAQVDWLHLIVVREDKSYFSFDDRLDMIKRGCAGIKNLTIHASSDYVISRATFPSYFLKDQGVINYSHTAIDLQLFRKHIAPALGITHRFAGSEPTDVTTNFYNGQMAYWLGTSEIDAKPIEFIELPRIELNSEPISASLVRKYMMANEWEKVKPLVPETTFHYLQDLSERKA